MIKYFTYLILFSVGFVDLNAQACCSGGGGSPIAGGLSLGVLNEKQFEVASNFQIFQSNRFLAGREDTIAMFKNYHSRYVYNRFAYGITPKLTLSFESGYFLNKTQSGFEDGEKQESGGIGDLLIFPRYNVLNKNKLGKHTEASLGLGYKIPLGKYNDSAVVYENPISGQKIYAISPPIIQPTTGSHDLLFYGFLLHSIKHNKWRFFTNAIYIKRGWNALGQKFGDYSALNLFASAGIAKNVIFTLQTGVQHTGRIQAARNVDLLALYNIDTESTGFMTCSVTPQVSYIYKGLVGYFMGEIPFYQKVNGVQLASEYQFTFGLAYRFYTSKELRCSDDAYLYQCSMKCEGGGSNEPGQCKVCGMDLEKTAYDRKK